MPSAKTLRTVDVEIITNAECCKLFTGGTVVDKSPFTFSMVGFAYGKVETTSRKGKVKVKLVANGRWPEEDAQTTKLTEADIVHGRRGWVLCRGYHTSSVGRSPNVGLWIKSRLSLGCCAETRAAQCHLWEGNTSIDKKHKITILVIVQEMKQCHDKVYHKFNGIDETAVRDTRLLLGDVGGKLVGESRVLPLLDISSFEISQVTIRSILDYVYYKEGGRTTPPGMVFGASIFDEAPGQTDTETQVVRSLPAVSSVTEVVLSDGLSDSDEEANTNEESKEAERCSRTTRQLGPKRRRLTKNVLPAVSEATNFSLVTGAVDVLCSTMQHLYQPVVHDTLQAAPTFLGELRVIELPTSTEALAEITAWIDDRLCLEYLSLMMIGNKL
ncbi:hypothetical protein PHMEG_0003577 [Phytophthora megakarya]|uniref:Uncharacterized protein n=1 Tax=Phytophthora megakarya TaxID=4795 RepID=A0A225WVY7_9STRA|nr:hypothetical protein PHMEG_0003577 [Phytophthora megakarya]